MSALKKKMKKTLEQRIRERIQQAQDRDIIQKANLVAQGLGEETTLKDDDDATVRGPVYESGSLEVSKLTVHAFGSQGFSGRDVVSITVNHFNQTVFQSDNGDIKAYIPGRWERRLDRLYAGLPQQTRAASGYSHQELQERAAQFGFKL